MKKLLTSAAIALALAATPQMAAADGHANSVKLQLQWVTQAQFAGYYVALDKGFYEEEGLEVEILPGGPDIAPPQVLAGGGADVMLNWMPSAGRRISKARPSASGSSAMNTRSCHGCLRKASPPMAGRMASRS